MAQKIVTLCDQHLGLDVEAAGEPWEVSLTPPGAKSGTYATDLCPECAKPLIELLDYLNGNARAVRGVKRSKTPAPDAPVAAGDNLCPFPGCDVESVSRAALATHTRHVHNRSLQQLDGTPTPYVCTEPGCGVRSTRPQGLAQHVLKTHRRDLVQSEREPQPEPESTGAAP